MAATPSRNRSIRPWTISIATSGSPIARSFAASPTPAADTCSLTRSTSTYLCDPSLRKVIIDRGEDPDTLPAAYARMINAAIADIPPDMTITMHLCRGNFRSNFVASGGYEPVAEILFNAINVHGYFMEYDSARAGGFEPLRFVPKGKSIVLGLVTSKSGTLEKKDDIKRRIERGGKVRPARSALPVAAMRFCLDRGGQCAGRGRRMGETADDRRARRRSVGISR